ncbi:hypothetical protein JXA47_02475 [Candidatus Sumerlaeota bacterium]|nr:hypothetical protein [Candidatus Sumerlaeota bacterium]
MTTGFGTSNICWVPEGQCFRFIDLLRWTEWRLDLERWQLAIAPRAVEHLVNTARHGFNEIRKRGSGPAEALDRGEHLVESLESLITPTPDDLADLHLPTGPLSALWVRVSDVPLESFFDEDYRPITEGVESHACLPAIGALSLPECDELEVPLVGGVEENFSVLTPGYDFVAEYPLPLDQIPPILDEYCGLQGNSNQGKMVNLTCEGRIAGENPVSLPLHRLDERAAFATLYLHFSTASDATVLLPLQRGHRRRVEASLSEQGFECVRCEGENRVWRRGQDWVHTIWDAPGPECEGIASLPPMIAVAQAEGSREPALRESLLAAILRTAQGRTAGTGD